VEAVQVEVLVELEEEPELQEEPEPEGVLTFVD
jgi:hypothetical protein